MYIHIYTKVIKEENILGYNIFFINFLTTCTYRNIRFMSFITICAGTVLRIQVKQEVLSPMSTHIECLHSNTEYMKSFSNRKIRTLYKKVTLKYCFPITLFIKID